MDSKLLISTNCDSQITLDRIELPPVWFPLPTWFYVLNIQFDDGPDDVSLFFRNPTHCIQKSIGVTSSTLLTPARSLNTGTCPGLVKNVVPLPWNGSVDLRPTISNSKPRKLKLHGLKPLILRIGNLCVRAWIVIVEILAADLLLDIACTDSCIRAIFHVNKKTSNPIRLQW